MSPGPAVAAIPSIASRRCVGQRLLDHGNDRFQMFAGGELGNHAAVSAVDRVLGRHDGGEQSRRDVVHGGGGLVAGALYAKDTHYRMFAASSASGERSPLTRRTCPEIASSLNFSTVQERPLL